MIAIVDRFPGKLEPVGTIELAHWRQCDPTRRFRTLWSCSEYQDVLLVLQGPGWEQCLPQSFIGEKVFVLRNWEPENLARLAQIHKLPERWLADQSQQVFKVTIARSARETDIAHSSLSVALYRMLVMNYTSPLHAEHARRQGRPVFAGGSSYDAALVALNERLRQQNRRAIRSTVVPYRIDYAGRVPAGSSYVGVAYVME